MLCIERYDRRDPSTVTSMLRGGSKTLYDLWAQSDHQEEQAGSLISRPYKRLSISLL